MRCSKRRAGIFEDLLDHLVGATKQRDRKGEAERLSGLACLPIGPYSFARIPT